jgi:hypothetical protein
VAATLPRWILTTSPWPSDCAGRWIIWNPIPSALAWVRSEDSRSRLDADKGGVSGRRTTRRSIVRRWPVMGRLFASPLRFFAQTQSAKSAGIGTNFSRKKILICTCGWPT